MGISFRGTGWAEVTGKEKKEDYFSVFNTELTTHPSPFTGQ